MALLSLLACVAFAGQARGSITVFAAASLKEAFTAIARSFEGANPGAKVRLEFAGSQLLATQLAQGASADVFAAADTRTFDRAPIDPSSRRVFARNQLAIVVRRGPGSISTVQDLPRAPKIVVADRAVPVGAYTEAFLGKAARRYGSDWRRRVLSHVVSHELDVKAVLAKVKLGEADAGVVYVTDARAAHGGVGVVAIPTPLNIFAEYPIGVPKTAHNPSAGRKLIAFILSAEGQKALRADGFLPPQ